jgi:HD-GYP domain-containing protein (c-di-GMP phosphodiesterase class II)
MDANEVKTRIDGLKPGMFVSKLDRPWIETPFLLEGVLLESSEQIETLRQCCGYVYVDINKGLSPDTRYVISDGGEAGCKPGEEPATENAPGDVAQNEYEQLRRRRYEDITTFADELPAARKIKEKLDLSLMRVLNDVKVGGTLDIVTVKAGVEEVVSSIIRNPSALSLLVQLERSDDYTYGRALSTSVWCAQFGRRLGLEHEGISELGLGGMLLDIGKVKLPGALLNKKGTINADEISLLHRHVDFSVRILAKTQALPVGVLRMVATHHERADGSGYPEGLKNGEIPIFGRIAGIVDNYDAMTAKRPYTDIVLTPHDAIVELYNSRGVLFQPELIEQFIQTVGLYPAGSLIEFETGEVGVVIAVNEMKRLHPTVMLILGRDKRPLAQFTTIDLALRPEKELRVAKALPRGAYGIKMEELFL